MTPYSIEQFLKNAVLGNSSVPVQIAKGIANKNKSLIAAGVRKVYEDSGILDVINKACYEGIKLVAYLGKKITDEREEVGKGVYINFPRNEKEAKKIADKFEKKFKDETVKILALASIYVLSVNNEIYKLRKISSGVIKILVKDKEAIEKTDMKKLEEIIIEKL